jgi:hypothetical protein
MPRTLYFDLDGTVVVRDFGHVKPKLADGGFERAIRHAGFERLVCVANMCTIVTALLEIEPDTDGRGMILQLCQGAFQDETWFRRVTTLIPDGAHRARHIDFAGDWWWADDRPAKFLALEGLLPLLDQHRGHRLMVTDPDGDGSDLIEWFERIR